jgi:hypothetical protein
LFLIKKLILSPYSIGIAKIYEKAGSKK